MESRRSDGGQFPVTVRHLYRLSQHASVYCGFTRSVVCRVLQYGHIVSVCIVHEDHSQIIAIKYQFPVFYLFSLILLQQICLSAILLPHLAIFFKYLTLLCYINEENMYYFYIYVLYTKIQMFIISILCMYTLCDAGML